MEDHSRRCLYGSVQNTLLPVLRPYLCFYYTVRL
jgi:hypothetical protein